MGQATMIEKEALRQKGDLRIEMRSFHVIVEEK